MATDFQLEEPIECQHIKCKNMADYLCFDHYYCSEHIGAFVRALVTFRLARAPKIISLHPDKTTRDLIDQIADQAAAEFNSNNPVASATVIHGNG